MDWFYSIMIITLLSLDSIESKRKRPNIIMFVADDLGYGDLSYYGHPTSSTPHIDNIISKSMWFSNYYTTSPVSSPSRASLFTGEYPMRSGIYPGVFFPNSTGGLDPSKKTIMKELRDRFGYKSALIGKWHLGVGKNAEYLPTVSKNFDSYYGIPYSHDMCPCTECFPNKECSSSCNSNFVPCPLFEDNGIKEQPTNLSKLTQKYTNRAIQFIKSNRNNSYFLTYAFHQTHDPQFAGLKFVNTSIRGSFGDALSEMDDAIGQIMQFLKKSDLLTETLVIFTSANGPNISRQGQGGCAGPFRCGKGTTYEGGVRVPLFMHWSGFIQPYKSHVLITALDIYPTLMSMVSVQYKNSTDGFDFTRHILKQKLDYNPRELLLYFPGHANKTIGPYAVRYKNYKAHFYTEGNELSDGNNYDIACTKNANLTHQNPPLLYDLNLDPGERFPMNIHDNHDIILEIQYEAFKKLKTINWADGEMLKPNSNDAQPCSRKGCRNFPECCNTLSTYPTIMIV
ncbi:arylsulfatase A [Lepeophtheirus salmonis]|uniref:arylsulfatase A n=1 Tax=Lepeophtheirus salmonis TaxID=72036 RepID=UPI001AE55375|nr:arylsulfatase A-like [Lepeophtheirus salmonis]